MKEFVCDVMLSKTQAAVLTELERMLDITDVWLALGEIGTKESVRMLNAARILEGIVESDECSDDPVLEVRICQLVQQFGGEAIERDLALTHCVREDQRRLRRVVYCGELRVNG